MVVAFIFFYARLIFSINKKEKLMNKQTNEAGAYSSERSSLLVVGSIFIISFMIDSLYNFIVILK